MQSIIEMKRQAGELRKTKKFSEALPLYKDIWENHPAERNEWDGWGYAFCLRKLQRTNEALEIAREVYRINSEFEQGKNLYAWCVYDIEIKKDITDIRHNEEIFFKAASGILQLVVQDDYTPYVRTVFKVLDYLDSKPHPQHQTTLKWLDCLDPETLSTSSFSFTDQQGKRQELSSDKEKWYALRSKTLYKLEKYADCINTCKTALHEISRFHYSNDIWFRWRIALSEENLGNNKAAIEDLKEILQYKNEWFVHFEIAKILLVRNDVQQAFYHAVEAALLAGDMAYKWDLFAVMGKILEKENHPELAAKHVALAIKVRESQDWKIPEELSVLASRLKVNTVENININNLTKELKIFWSGQKYSKLPKTTGEIKTILPHGKAGFIQAENGKDYYFKIRSFREPKIQLSRGLAVEFQIEDSFDPKKQKKTEIAVNIKPL